MLFMDLNTVLMVWIFQLKGSEVNDVIENIGGTTKTNFLEGLQVD